MPTIQPPAKVLVSGANGFVAVWVIQRLLDKGYSMRGTIRSLEKGKYLKDLFETYGDRFELVIVEDIAKEGSFDEAVKGVDAIEHTASPHHYDADDPEEVIRPAVDGTLGILKSAQKHGRSVKRIVVTSSVFANFRWGSAPLVLTEADWGNQWVEEVGKLGKNASNLAKYAASKTLAEKAAWEFYETNKGSITWDLVALNPPYVYGPILHEVSAPSKLNTSALDWYSTVVSRTISATRPGADYVDVRDLAEAHISALVSEDAKGERFIVSAGFAEWQHFIDAADGKPFSTTEVKPAITFDSTKGGRVFGIKYRSLEETTKDSITEYKRRGW